MDAFNNTDITPEDIAVMQRLFTRLRGSTSGSEAIPPPASPLPSAPPPSQPLPSSISITHTHQQLNQALLATQFSDAQPISEPYMGSAISQALPATQNIRRATSRRFGHAIPSTARAPSSSQPFLGSNELSIGMTGQVNQRRLASAAAHLPRAPRLVTRGGRTNRGVHRGPAIHPPSLPRSPSLEDCTYLGPDPNGNNVPMIHIKVYVYPPKPPSSSRAEVNDFILYRIASPEVDAFLDRFGLICLYDIPLSKPLRDLADTIARDLENSEHGFTFTRPARNRYIPGYEPPALDLLSIINRGRRRPSTGAIHLRVAHTSNLVDINAIANNRSFLVPNLTLQNSRLVLYFVIREHPVTMLTIMDPADEIARLHTCLSRKFYFMFRQDAFHADPNEPSSDEDEEDEIEDELLVRRQSQQLVSSRALHHDLSTRVHSPTPSIGNSPSSPGDDPPTSPVIHSNPLQRGDSLVTLSVLPRTIWTQNFTPSAGRYRGEFVEQQSILDKIYHLASIGSGYSELSIRGPTTRALAASLRTLIECAARKGDFTDVLSRNRLFQRTDDNDRNLSNGVGIEREVLQDLFDQFKIQDTTWFEPNDDGFSLLATSLTLAASRSVSSDRKLAMSVLGAIVALCLMRGVSAAPLDPLFVYLCVYGFSDINAIRPDLLAEYHPKRKQIISDWIATGPTGDVASFQGYFASYHDLQASRSSCDVGRLHNRDQSVHNGMAVQMLYRVVVGSEPPSHPEIQAFRYGFDLPCRNGFRFSEVLKSVPGGCESFLAMAYSSHMSSFNALREHLDIAEPLASEMEPIRQALGDPSLSLTTILLDFLRGKGAPCPHLLSAVSVHFPSIVDLSHIDEDGFRAKHFCWAATGTCERELGASQIQIKFVQDNDLAYAYGMRHLTRAMAAEGKICYATCSQTASIPMSYVLKLAMANYPDASGEPKTFVEAVHHWLLCEVLNAVDAHTIL